MCHACRSSVGGGRIAKKGPLVIKIPSNRERKGVRKRKALSNQTSNSSPIPAGVSNTHESALPSPHSVSQATYDSHSDAIISADRHGFIASDSILSYQPSGSATENPSPLRNWQKAELFLRGREFHGPLKSPMQQALVESFSDHLFYLYPLFEPSELEEPNLLPLILQKGLWMSGSLLRRVATVEDLILPHTLYQQTKNLIYGDSHQGDSIAILKAICLVSCWSPRPPDMVSMDGPWH